MDPLTIAIINFLITFLVAKKKGLSSTRAALAATGTAAAGYYLAGGTFGGHVPPVSTSTSTAVTGFYGDAKDHLKDGAKWIASNPGTAAALGTGLGLATVWKKYIPWIIGGVVGILLLRGGSHDNSAR